MLNKLFKMLHFIEDTLLVSLVLAVIGLSISQVVLRNIGVSGLIWMDPAARVAVLWLAMFGALRASREQKHIVIDLLSHYSKPLFRRFSFFVISVATAGICFFAAYFSFLFVYSEYQAGLDFGYDMAFLNVPAWVAQSIIPVGLALIGLRSLLYSLTPPELSPVPLEAVE